MVTTMRGALLAVSAAAAMAMTAVAVAGQSAVAGPAARGTGFAPEADVSHHGHASLRDGRLGVSLYSDNQGPSSLSNTTVRLRFSAPVAARQELPDGCVRGGDRAVLCGTGALGVGGEARRTVLALRITGQPAEVVVRVDTVWNGGASDRDQRNNTREVLVPATGGPYVF